MMRLTELIVLATFLAIAVDLHAGDDPMANVHRVAKDRFDDPSACPHLAEGQIYQYPAKIITDAANRQVAFGNRVVFRYAGLVPDAHYKLRLTFVSDSTSRVQRIIAGGKVLKDHLAIPLAKALSLTLDVPAEAFKNKSLEVVIEKVAGPNAVVSSVEIWSTDATELKGAEVAPLPPPVMPRLSPGPHDRKIELSGVWKFNAAPAGEFWNGETGAGWSDIQVPGEWAMQGFVVEANKAAGYVRTFAIPGNWSGSRVKLRCDAVYSDATVWINGKLAGKHLGGFTPFELDVTDLVKAGENRIALAVMNESIADALASGSRYAAHPLGGITRKICLFATPEVNVAGFHAITTFDKDYRDATLKVELEIANEGPGNVANAQVKIDLTGVGGVRQMPVTQVAQVQAVSAGQTVRQVVEIPVSSPAKWEAEHPNLYQLTCTLERGGQAIQTVSRRIGFRQVEVRGNQVFVNNVPVKLRGVCRHETHPTLGRALTPELWRKDAEIFRAGNCNYIRTSHYPPAEEFIDACDELGLFVEEEAPFCWAGSNSKPANLGYTVQAELEMIQRDRSHPSIIQWSLGNESQPWGANFAAAQKIVRKLDPSRPEAFEICGDIKANPGLNIDVTHYPGPGGPGRFADHPKPIVYGEFCHLNAYNRHELVTDPGVRDAWGMGFAKMWEGMRASQGVEGGSIWAAIDDSFFVPPNQTVGYGTWGPIDGWRRLKPEYWHMKKTYSPVRVSVRALKMPQGNNVLRIPVENRHLYTNLKELRVDWRLGEEKGSVAGGDIPPGACGVLEIGLTKTPAAGPELGISFTNALGVEVDREILTIGKGLETPVTARGQAQPASLQEHPSTFTLSCGTVACEIDRGTGRIVSLKRGETIVMAGGPHLMVLPLNGNGGTQMQGVEPSYAPFTEPCGNWKGSEIKAGKSDDGVQVQVTGSNADAAGRYTITLDHYGALSVAYRFTMTKAINPRQVGVVFDVPRSLDTLQWRRLAQWTAYPEDHIGRPVGSAKAFPHAEKSGPAGPRTQPSWAWSQDCNELGSNDFRSTKFNILEAALVDAAGAGLGVSGDGSQHVRAWINGEQVGLAVLDYANPGAERFFKSHAQQWYKPLKQGDVVEGTIRLSVK